MRIWHGSILSAKRSGSTVLHNIIFIQGTEIKSQKHLEKENRRLTYNVSLNKKIEQA